MKPSAPLRPIPRLIWVRSGGADGPRKGGGSRRFRCLTPLRALGPAVVRLSLLTLIACVCAFAARAPRIYTATAYSVSGVTAAGHDTHRGTIAADPAILPFGTRIRITHAGRYSGVYTVQDSGRKIQGAKLDLYMPSAVEAKRFGKRRVRVQVLKVGDGKIAPAPK